MGLSGVKSRVSRTIMQWSLRLKGWRAVLIRMALLTSLWLVVAFVFATEFYLSARGGPVKIPWSAAVGSAFRDWYPWVLLSPGAVILAGRFRFDRGEWRRSLAIHAAACVLFTLAYQGLLILAYPRPYLLSTGGMVGVSSGADVGPPGLPPPDVVAGVTSALPIASPDVSVFGEAGGVGFSARSNAVVFRRENIFNIGAGPASLPPEADTVFVRRTEGPPPADGGTPGVGSGFHIDFRTFGSVNLWQSFLHMAALRTQFTVPIYLCIVCVCWVIGHFQESGEREHRTLELETRLTKANLQALKMQLQPHFLFNTLNSISSLVHENPGVADDMIASLSQFLRTTLDVSAKNEVPLRTELEFVDRYLEIQQIRFGDRLRVCREIDPAVIDALVPPLILQPLVENAIRYGIESRETGGTVTICAQREGDVLRLEIVDDGEGFSGGQMLEPGNGIGLSNTKARLQELYGARHQLKITANNPTGARVKIEIPFKFSTKKKLTHEYSSAHC